MVQQWSAVVALLGSAFWSLPKVTFGWDKDGHEAIAMTTMSALEQEATAQVKHLMHGRDVVDVSAWAHKVNKKFPWTTELHFQRQPEEACSSGPVLSVCPGNKCMLGALKYFYGRLVNQPTDEIDFGAGVKLTDADCVKYLINLIGDLHQPMHFAMEPEIMVTYHGTKMSLFDLWDKELTQSAIKANPGFWWGGWTHIQRATSDFDNDSRQWKDKGVLEFERWASQSVDALCKTLYTDPFSQRSVLAELKTGNFVVTDQLFEVWKKEMLQKILVAGARVAVVLNSVLQHREGKDALKDGTAVITDADDVDEPSTTASFGLSNEVPRGTNVLRGIQATLINAAIFLGVYVVFMHVMSRWRGKDIVAKADREKKQPDGGKKI